jgi:tetratricopeptide (TPR) repeat protein
MNKQTFTSLIRKPDQITDKELDTLENLAANFPYCQIAHILIAKAHYSKGSMLVHQKLKKASAYAINRALLKSIVTDSRKDKFVFRYISQQPTGEATTDTPGTSPVVATQTQEKARAKAKRSFESEMELEAILKNNEDRLANELSQLKSDAIALQEQANATDPADTAKTDSIAEQRRKQQELIDRFITLNPRLTPLTLESKQPDNNDLAQESAKFDTSLVSENLAVIFTKQGKKNKAIEIYKKLILKYPEKSDYFADKIDLLENKNL